MRLTQGIHRARQISPNQLALRTEQADYSWADFADRVARLAAGLSQLGVRAGDRVAVLAPNSGEYVECYFAVLWAGGVLLPINTRWASPEIRYCLDDAEPGVLFLAAEFRNLLPDLLRAPSSVTAVIHFGATSSDSSTPEFPDKRVNYFAYEALVSANKPADDAMRGGDDLACLFYTGGTTGRAKGVMLSHGNLLANSFSALPNLGFSGQSVHLHAAPMFHLAGGSRVFTTTVAGATHAIIARFEPEDFLAAIERFRVTLTVIVPTMLNRLLQLPNFEDFDLGSLELLSYGASPMPDTLLRLARSRLPGVKFLQSYGMTELSPVATMLLPAQHEFEGPNQRRLRSAGQAVFNADIAVFDEADQPVPEGAIGEVCVRGPMVMRGYWRQPDLTAEVIRGGWMHTGDAGYLDKDGFLFLVDRIKDMIVTGGENVYSAAVENILYRYPGVRECAVIGIPSDIWGEAVHAVVVPMDGVVLDSEALISHCRSYLAGYECPKSIEIRQQELPKSGPGKILKADLRKSFWKGQERSVH